MNCQVGLWWVPTLWFGTQRELNTGMKGEPRKNVSHRAHTSDSVMPGTSGIGRSRPKCSVKEYNITLASISIKNFSSTMSVTQR